MPGSHHKVSGDREADCSHIRVGRVWPSSTNVRLRQHERGIIPCFCLSIVMRSIGRAHFPLASVDFILVLFVSTAHGAIFVWWLQHITLYRKRSDTTR